MSVSLGLREDTPEETKPSVKERERERERERGGSRVCFYDTFLLRTRNVCNLGNLQGNLIDYTTRGKDGTSIGGRSTLFKFEFNLNSGNSNFESGKVLA